MKHKTSRSLFGYWNSVRADRVAPQRFEIDPSRISALLPYTFILERLDAETFRFRLAGTRMCEVFGGELRSTNFLDGWAAGDRLALLRQFSVMTGQAAVIVLYVELATFAEDAVECETLLLPLQHTRGTIDRILGVFSPLAQAAWLGEKPATSKRLVANEFVWPGSDPRQAIPRTPPAAEPAVFHSRNARIVRSERMQLRVFDGGLSGSDVDKS